MSEIVRVIDKNREQLRLDALARSPATQQVRAKTSTLRPWSPSPSTQLADPSEKPQNDQQVERVVNQQIDQQETGDHQVRGDGMFYYQYRRCCFQLIGTGAGPGDHPQVAVTQEHEPAQKQLAIQPYAQNSATVREQPDSGPDVQPLETPATDQEQLSSRPNKQQPASPQDRSSTQKIAHRPTSPREQSTPSFIAQLVTISQERSPSVLREDFTAPLSQQLSRPETYRDQDTTATSKSPARVTKTPEAPQTISTPTIRAQSAHNTAERSSGHMIPSGNSTETSQHRSTSTKNSHRPHIGRSHGESDANSKTMWRNRLTKTRQGQNRSSQTPSQTPGSAPGGSPFTPGGSRWGNRSYRCKEEWLKEQRETAWGHDPKGEFD